jgi:hypothetical protein
MHENCVVVLMVAAIAAVPGHSVLYGKAKVAG